MKLRWVLYATALFGSSAQVNATYNTYDIAVIGLAGGTKHGNKKLVGRYYIEYAGR